jgi:hypothetical protein
MTQSHTAEVKFEERLAELAEERQKKQEQREAKEARCQCYIKLFTAVSYDFSY